MYDMFVVFEKNGQGKWDFDFEGLAEMTSVEFAARVRGEVCHSYVSDVSMEIVSYGIFVYYVDVNSINTLYYSFETGDIVQDNITAAAALRMVKQFEKHWGGGK